MNWNAIGSVAEALGSLGVIITVAYLAVQVRQNSRQLASSLSDSIRNGFNETTRILASDPEAARVFRVGIRDLELLTDSERYQFDALLTLAFYGQQQAFVNGQITETGGLEWLLTFPGGQKWWADNSSLLSREFREYIKVYLENQSHAT